MASVKFGNGSPRQPVVVALVNDFELVVRGLATMLRPFRDRIQVVELDLGRNPEYEVDVALFDAYGHAQLGLDRVASLAHAPNVDAVAVYTSAATSEQRDAAFAAGARAVISKSIAADELADAILAVASGQQVVSEAFGEDHEPRWPGHEFGLTLRESEVAAQLTQAKTNKDIAAALWISENTVKTHLKSIYQKTATTSRSQAIVRLAGEFGFARRSA